MLNNKNLVNNYGFYIFIFIMLLYIITIFIFWFISYKKLKKDVLVMIIILNRINKSEIKKSIIKEKENQTIENIKGNNKRIKIKKKKIITHIILIIIILMT